MRDPARIPEMLEKLKKIWEERPDMRFGQLVEFIRFEGEVPVDFFYVEDPVWEYAFDEVIRLRGLKQDKTAQLLKNLEKLKSTPITDVFDWRNNFERK